MGIGATVLYLYFINSLQSIFTQIILDR